MKLACHILFVFVYHGRPVNKAGTSNRPFYTEPQDSKLEILFISVKEAGSSCYSGADAGILQKGGGGGVQGPRKGKQKKSTQTSEGGFGDPGVSGPGKGRPP